MYMGFENLTLSYGRKNIIENLSLSIPKGKITTIIGRNGCGKSTLVKTLSRIMKPKSGSVIIKDRNINTYKQRELAYIISILPQKHHSPGDIDVRTLVSYGRVPHLKMGENLRNLAQEIIDEALRSTGLREMQHRRISELSGGEQKRAWIAMTLCQGAEIIVLDEPTTHLDISYQYEVMELLRDLNRKKNLTIVVVLHDLNLAATYADNIVALCGGNVLGQGVPYEVFTEKILKEIYGIDIIEISDDEKKNIYYVPKNNL